MKRSKSAPRRAPIVQPTSVVTPPRTSQPASSRKSTGKGVTPAKTGAKVPANGQRTPKRSPASAGKATPKSARVSARVAQKGRPDYNKLMRSGKAPRRSKGADKDEADGSKPTDIRLQVSKGAGVHKVSAPKSSRQQRSAVAVPAPRMTPDWRGFIPVVGPLMYMFESFTDAVYGFLGLSSASDASAPQPATAQ